MQFISELIKEREQFYETKRENKDTFIKGLVFVIATCLLDWGLSSL